MNAYSFRSKVWKSKGKGGWHFVTLPEPLSKKIRKNHGLSEEGWGRLKTLAKTGQSIWETCVWYDTQKESYVLPLKASIRKAEIIRIDAEVLVILKFYSDNEK